MEKQKIHYKIQKLVKANNGRICITILPLVVLLLAVLLQVLKILEERGCSTDLHKRIKVFVGLILIGWLKD